MNYRKVFKSILAGDWEGIEVHDRELLTKYVIYAAGIVLLIGIGGGINSCSQQDKDYPPHIQVSV